jgi:uncharacterized protein
MMSERPFAEPTSLTEGFWAAASRHELVVQRCVRCALLRHYPQPMCPGCRSMEWVWVQVSGRGTIYTFTVTYQAFHTAWAGEVPYVVATIELEEGVRLVSDIAVDDVEIVEIGMPVEVFFDETITSGGRVVALPRFRPGIRPQS